jgi:hypothetical protein
MVVHPKKTEKKLLPKGQYGVPQLFNSAFRPAMFFLLGFLLLSSLLLAGVWLFLPQEANLWTTACGLLVLYMVLRNGIKLWKLRETLANPEAQFRMENFRFWQDKPKTSYVAELNRAQRRAKSRSNLVS